MRRKVRWFTPEEDALITSKVYEQFGAAYVACRLDRSVGAVMGRYDFLKRPPKVCKLPGCGKPVPFSPGYRRLYCSEECLDASKESASQAYLASERGKFARARQYQACKSNPEAWARRKAAQTTEKARLRRNLLRKAARYAKAEGLTLDQAYAHFNIRRHIAKRRMGRPCKWCKTPSPEVNGNRRYCSDACSTESRRDFWRTRSRLRYHTDPTYRELQAQCRARAKAKGVKAHGREETGQRLSADRAGPPVMATTAGHPDTSQRQPPEPIA